jgi:hypothetical protein
MNAGCSAMLRKDVDSVGSQLEFRLCRASLKRSGLRSIAEDAHIFVYFACCTLDIATLSLNVWRR